MRVIFGVDFVCMCRTGEIYFEGLKEENKKNIQVKTADANKEGMFLAIAVCFSAAKDCIFIYNCNTNQTNKYITINPKP